VAVLIHGERPGDKPIFSLLKELEYMKPLLASLLICGLAAIPVAAFF
jgi:hypothetical protein